MQRRLRDGPRHRARVVGRHGEVHGRPVPRAPVLLLPVPPHARHRVGGPRLRDGARALRADAGAGRVQRRRLVRARLLPVQVGLLGRGVPVQARRGLWEGQGGDQAGGVLEEEVQECARARAGLARVAQGADVPRDVHVARGARPAAAQPDDVPVRAARLPRPLRRLPRRDGHQVPAGHVARAHQVHVGVRRVLRRRRRGDLERVRRRGRVDRAGR